MNILYTCDNSYVWLMGISMISLFENNANINSITVYLLGENISESNQALICEIADKYKHKCIVIDMPEIDIPDSLLSTRWPKSAFYRLFAGEVLPAYIGRILYLDCDTIIMDSISDLDKFDISDKYLYGVKDCIGRLYKKNIGLAADDMYINAGVLLMNLDKMRKLNVSLLIDKYMKTYIRLINYADQDVLNGLFKGKIGELSPQYNVMTINFAYSYNQIKKLRRPTNFYNKVKLKKAIENPIIIHYTTNMRIIRPWYRNSDHPKKEEFIRYLNYSPWDARELETMSFHSNVEKIISIIEKFPQNISFTILGFLHSILKPLYIRLTSKRG